MTENEGSQPDSNKSPEGTGGKPKEEPAATPPKDQKPKQPESGKDNEPATEDDEKVTISKKDLKNLQSQRDGNHERVSRLEAQQAQQAFEKEAGKFLNENKDKYPDVDIEDLEQAETAEDFDNLATIAQKRISEKVQKRLGEIQKAGKPAISKKDKASRLKELRENPGEGSFQEMLELEATPTTD